MKILLTACLLASLTGCTPEIREYSVKQWKDMKAYDYGQISDVFGFNEVFPTYNDQMRRDAARMCMHDDSENRVIFMDGTNDEMYYRRCTLQPYPENKPIRFTGR